MARPEAQIDEEQLIKLAELHCTYEEIADWFGVDKSTICRRYATEIKQARARCKCSLRRTQFELAKRSSSMAIHLGEQHLGQSKKTEINMNAVLSPFEKFAMTKNKADSEEEESNGD